MQMKQCKLIWLGKSRQVLAWLKSEMFFGCASCRAMKSSCWALGAAPASRQHTRKWSPILSARCCWARHWAPQSRTIAIARGGNQAKQCPRVTQKWNATASMLQTTRRPTFGYNIKILSDSPGVEVPSAHRLCSGRDF